MSILAKAATEFLKDESRRTKRPRFSDEERESLEGQLKMLSQTGPDSDSCAFRGAVAVDLLSYESDFEDRAVNVIADILHALRKAGENPLIALAHARAEYMRDINEAETIHVEPAEVVNIPEDWTGTVPDENEGENDGA